MVLEKGSFGQMPIVQPQKMGSLGQDTHNPTRKRIQKYLFSGLFLCTLMVFRKNCPKSSVDFLIWSPMIVGSLFL